MLIKSPQHSKLIYGTIICILLVSLLIFARIQLRKHAIIIKEYVAYGLLKRAENLLNHNKNEEALSLIEQAMELNLKDDEDYTLIGNMMFKIGKYEDALRNYEESIKIHPNYLAYYNLGALFDVMKKNDEAIEAYQKALEVQPNGVGAHADLGWDLYYQGRMVEAEKQLKIALELKPQLPEHQIILAFILIQKKEIDEASQHLRLAIQYKPDLYQAYYVLGQIAMMQGDDNQAIKYYKNALRLRPDFERARNELANILEHQKKTP